MLGYRCPEEVGAKSCLACCEVWGRPDGAGSDVDRWFGKTARGAEIAFYVGGPRGGAHTYKAVYARPAIFFGFSTWSHLLGGRAASNREFRFHFPAKGKYTSELIRRQRSSPENIDE